MSCKPMAIAYVCFQLEIITVFSSDTNTGGFATQHSLSLSLSHWQGCQSVLRAKMRVWSSAAERHHQILQPLWT